MEQQAGIDISANADKAYLHWDISGSQNSSYRIFNSRIFLYTIGSTDHTYTIGNRCARWRE